MYWKITRDYLFEKEDNPDLLQNRVGMAQGRFTSETNTFRTLDDDGEVYYEASCDESGSEHFHDWSMVDSGTVLTQEINSKGEWVDVFG